MLLKFEKCECVKSNYKTRCLSYCKFILHYERDKIMSDYAKNILNKVHMNKNNIQEMFLNIAKTFSINCDHAYKIYDYMSKGWFAPSTPVTRFVNGFDEYPISCFVTTLTNKKDVSLMKQMMTMYKQSLGGGGMGVNISNVHEFKCINSLNLNNGVLCYVKAIEAMFDILKPDKGRPPIFVYYLDVSHPDILDFIDIRKPTFDVNKMRLAGSSHVGIIIDDKFMNAVVNKTKWNLISQVNGKICDEIDAIDLWRKILIARSETGEPFIFFNDNAQKSKAEAYRKLNIDVPCTNMCTEIMLPSGLDHRGIERSTICCLGSVNLEYFDEWKNDDDFIPAVMLFLDCVMQYYIDNSSGDDLLFTGWYCATMSRPIGMGTMGWAFLLQKKMIAFGSNESFILNQEVFGYLYKKSEYWSIIIGEYFGHAPDNLEAGIKGRFVTKLAVAPTAYISLLCDSSPGINPFYSNYYVHKTAAGSTFIKNKYLSQIIYDKFGIKSEDIWHKILLCNGSIQSLDEFTFEEKLVFRTAFEIDQKKHIQLCGERQKYLTQTQSVNLYFNYNVLKKDISMMHVYAHSVGLPTLYYAFFSPRIQSNNQSDMEFNNLKNLKSNNSVSTCFTCGN